MFVFPGEDESGRKLVDFRIRIITEFNGIDKRESKGHGRGNVYKIEDLVKFEKAELIQLECLNVRQSRRKVHDNNAW